MKRTLWLLLPASMLLLSSCLGDEEETILSSEAAIQSFSIGTFKIKVNDINIYGRDTTIYETATGTDYPFTIDQKNNIIYSTDSLPYGSQLTRVLTSSSSAGNVYYRNYYDDNKYVDTLLTSSDSINLTRVKILIAASEDGSYIRHYKFDLKVHQVHPDSMNWHKYSPENFPTLSQPYSLIKGDSIYFYGIDELGKLSLSTCNIIDGSVWNKKYQVNGIKGEEWNSSVLLFKNKFFTVQNNAIFYSEDGRNWSDIHAGTAVEQIIPFNNGSFNDGFAWAIATNGDMVRSENLIEWVVTQQGDEAFPEKSITGLCYPLVGNSNILRNIIIGINNEEGYQNASIWTKLSSEDVWTKVEVSKNNTLLCPRLNRLSAIYYDNSIFAFGGKSQEGYGDIEGLNGFYQSSDNGITWRDCEEFFDEYSSWNHYMEFPKGLKGEDVDFSYVTDSHGYIWILTAKGNVWKGAINRLITK